MIRVPGLIRHTILTILLFTPASSAWANWTLNLGYHNPPHAQVGINFLYWGSNWNFEAGIGWINAEAAADDDSTVEEKNEKDELSLAISGDLNVKYRFSSGGIAPYVQFGMAAAMGAAVGDENDAGAGLGSPFVGLGLMFGKPSLYAYAAYNFWSSEQGEPQAGIGFDI
jgi:hypothetical protein